MLLGEVALVLSLKVNAHSRDTQTSPAFTASCRISRPPYKKRERTGSCNMVQAPGRPLSTNLLSISSSSGRCSRTYAQRSAASFLQHPCPSKTARKPSLAQPLELCSVAACVGILCAKRWTKGVHITSVIAVLCLKLSRKTVR